MDIAELRNRSDEELKTWTLSQDSSALRTMFTEIWNEIRGAKLSSGQPRSALTENSVSLAQVASRIAEYSGDESLVLESWRMLAYSLNADEQYEQSLIYYRQTIDGLERTAQHALACRTRIGYIAALFQSGQYQKALSVAEPAERWFKENGDEAGFARLCTNVANLYHRLDDHLKAYQYHSMAVETFERTGDKQALAQSYLNLGNALASIDQFQASDEMYERSQKLSMELGMTELWAQAGYNRGYLHFLRGRYTEALQGFSRLRFHFERAGSQRHYALCDLDEAEIYLQLNLSKDAAALAERASQRFKELGLDYEHAKATAFLGLALVQLGRFGEGLAAFQQAQAEFETEGNLYWVAVLDLYRADVKFTVKRFSEARDLASKANAQFEKIGIPSKRLLSLVILAKVSLALNEFAAADSYVDQAFGITQHANVPLLLFPYYMLRADISERKQQWAEAESFYEAAATELENHQSRLHDDQLRVTFSSGKNLAYEALVCLKLEKPNSENAAFNAYAWCERAKSRGLIELLANHLPAVHPHAGHSLTAKINRLREELNTHYARSQPELRPIPSLSSFETITTKENELARCLREVSLIDPEYASLQQVSAATLDKVQEILPDDTTLLEFFIARDEVIAFVISPTEASVHRHLCPMSRIVAIQDRLGFQLDKFMLGSHFVESHTDQIFDATLFRLGELHQSLIEPLLGQLRTRRVTIIPHGRLHFLPFHALFDGNRYLIDSFEISYAPSASVLKYCLEKDDIAETMPALVGVSDEAIPYVETEIHTIAEMFPGARMLLNENATRAAFRDVAHRTSFLHIATHSVFRRDNPMFSGFKLSDGWTTAFDLFSMDCQTNLVTLSACRSGMNQIAGSDDLVGLMRGFLYAGARSLLLSLWNVNDQVTSQLMAGFYDNWRRGKTKSEALASSMKLARETCPNPFFWAPFLLIGKP
jgi:tetratricopeptide (TPR) repeat protein